VRCSPTRSRCLSTRTVVRLDRCAGAPRAGPRPARTHGAAALPLGLRDRLASRRPRATSSSPRTDAGARRGGDRTGRARRATLESKLAEARSALDVAQEGTEHRSSRERDRPPLRAFRHTPPLRRRSFCRSGTSGSRDGRPHRQALQASRLVHEERLQTGFGRVAHHASGSASGARACWRFRVAAAGEPRQHAGQPARLRGERYLVARGARPSGCATCERVARAGCYSAGAPSRSRPSRSRCREAADPAVPTSSAGRPRSACSSKGVRPDSSDEEMARVGPQASGLPPDARRLGERHPPGHTLLLCHRLALPRLMMQSAPAHRSDPAPG